MSKILAVNAVKHTLSWKLFDMPAESIICSGAIDRIGWPDTNLTLKTAEQTNRSVVDITTQTEAVHKVLNLLLTNHSINALTDINGIGHRVVSGGEQFSDSVLIDDNVLQAIKNLADNAPLHNPAEAEEIEAFQQELPDVPQVAVFDTAFHTSIPKVNYLYSIPYEYYEKYGIRKFGAHGISHHYVADQAAKILHQPLQQQKMITVHMGRGVSLTAIQNGKSLDTSMGYTPLDGALMGTRSGNIDASLMAFIMQKLGITDPDEMISQLNTESGMLGISGLSSEIQDLEAAQTQNERAKTAIDIYVDRIVKYIGSYIGILGGLDTLVFTGKDGVSNSALRQRIIAKLDFFGVKLDAKKNQAVNGEDLISTDASTVYVLVIPSDEELVVARDVARIAKLG